MLPGCAPTVATCTFVPSKSYTQVHLYYQLSTNYIAWPSFSTCTFVCVYQY